VSEIPPITSPVAFLGWAVAGLGAVVGLLYRTAEKARDRELATLREAHAGEVASLKAQLDESRRREAERRDERDKLGRLYDEERAGRAWDLERMARAVALRTPPEAARSVASDWVELPTGVHDRLDLVAQALSPVPLPEAEERRLGRYVAGDPLSTPPEPAAQRPRLPSRSR
jgi:hypothetical protein